MKKINWIILWILFFSFPRLVSGEELNLSGKSYILIDESSGRVLYENNAHMKMPMASTTKIMTALVAIENSQKDDIICIDEDAVGIEGSSIYLKKGEKMTLEDILYGLMLRSGNDSAVAIGINVGGDIDNFVKMMNSKSKSIGALNTHFVNTNGLHDHMHYSTSYDLALITRDAFKHELFENIVGTKLYTSTREENNVYLNKNKTLWEYQGGDGVKTGYTTNSGRCLVSSAKRKNMRLIAVVLNGSDWFNDNYKLLNYGFENFKPYIIYDNGQYIKSLYIDNGKKKRLNLVTEDELIYPLREDEIDNILISTEIKDNIKLPINKGDKLGYIYTYLNGRLIQSTNLIASETVAKLNIIEGLWHKIKK